MRNIGFLMETAGIDSSFLDFGLLAVLIIIIIAYAIAYILSYFD